MIILMPMEKLWDTLNKMSKTTKEEGAYLIEDIKTKKVIAKRIILMLQHSYISSMFANH